MSSCRLQFHGPSTSSSLSPRHLSLIMFDCCHCSRTFRRLPAARCPLPVALRRAHARCDRNQQPKIQRRLRWSWSWWRAQARTQTQSRSETQFEFSIVCRALVVVLLLLLLFLSFGCVAFGLLYRCRCRRRVFKLYAFKKRLRINWIISFFFYFIFFLLFILEWILNGVSSHYLNGTRAS